MDGRWEFDRATCARTRLSVELAVGSAGLSGARRSDGGRGARSAANPRCRFISSEACLLAASGGSVDEHGRMRDHDRQKSGRIGLTKRVASGRASGQRVGRSEQLRGS